MKKTIVLFALALALCAVLSSCSIGNALLSAMGFDTHDYEAEEVEEVLSADSEEVKKYSEMVKMLSVNDPFLPEFTSSGEAVDSCRDAILNYMLSTRFAKYMGNVDLIEKAEADYPELELITVIPTEDFEDFVYTYFGGNAKLSHQDSELFTYLDKSDAYTAVTVPIESKISVEYITCEKTENTCRFKFRCTLGDVTSQIYRALIINRSDGSSYFKSLQIVTEE